ncbi:MAG: hypothetical protein CSA89_00640 [Bacteroidales bacterium]|nr:MAG: hypothetical protein CSA89_00640 [Bacteroidales bacterium]
MRKLFLLITSLLSAVNIFAQFGVISQTEYIQITDQQDIDAIFLFNGINSSTEISYNGTQTTEWRLYDNSFVANTPNFSPDDATGYILFDKTNNIALKHIWVIDYSLYLAKLNGLIIDGNCQNMNINTEFDIPNITFTDKNGKTRNLNRQFTITYTDYVFNGENWHDTLIVSKKTAPLIQITQEAPNKDVDVCIWGDQYSIALGIDTPKICASYKAIAIKSYPKGSIEKRDGTNEVKRDDSKNSTVIGSAPLVVGFSANANTPVASFFEWKIYRSDSPHNYFRYSEPDIHYTFKETGDYIARLQVLNSDQSCLYEDSIKISTLESLLEIPNAFSPNGDGINDEFRVIFKSIASYNIMIVNRWGRTVYKSTNPSVGWDGRIGNKPAAEGTYYYIIEATGTDKYTQGAHKGKSVIHKRKGHINLFR